MTDYVLKRCSCFVEYADMLARNLVLVHVCWLAKQLKQSRSLAVAVEKDCGWYESSARIGYGVMGYVVRVEATHLTKYGVTRDCAVKKMPILQYTDQGDFLHESLVSELVCLCMLEHERIAPKLIGIVIDECGKFAYLLMELMESSVCSYLGCGLDADVMAKRLFFMLDRVHSYGIVHLDIKTTNLLLNREGSIFLCDFGLAKAMDESGFVHRQNQPFVTLSHRPPELLMDMEEVGAFTDVWSAGIALSECLMKRYIVCKD